MARQSFRSHVRVLPLALVAFAAPYACSSADALAPETTRESIDAAPRADAAPIVPLEAAAPDASAPSDANVPDDEDAGDAKAIKDAKPDVPKGPFSCARDTSFPGSFAVAEASAAAEVELVAGVRELLVVSDSGHSGAAMLYGITTGATRSITLPLDAAGGDDVEGIAWRSGRLYTLTSSGAVRRFAPDGSGGLVRDQDTYALGATPYACSDLTAVNCGKNYEGLCLRDPATSHACAGYAASKADGKLYCLTLDAAGVLSASTTVAPLSLAVAADRLSDCAFGTAGGAGSDALVVTTNVYNLSRSYRVNEQTGALTQLPAASLLNNEAIAVDGDGVLYVFDDNSTATSTASRDRCVNW